MVEKGDKGLDATPTSSPEGAPANSGVAPPMGPRTRSTVESSDDSDVDESESELEDKSLGSDDTRVVDKLHCVGQANYDDTRCLVRLSLRVDGHALYCGHPRGTCPRPKHKILQQVPERRGVPGIYQQLPNASGGVHDAVADTLASEAEVKAQRAENRNLLSALGTSPEKQLTEQQAKPRLSPQVRTTPPSPASGPRAERIQTWAHGLPDTPTAGTQTAPTLQVASAPAPPASDPALVGLLTRMVERIDQVSMNQAALQRENGLILTRLETQATDAREHQREMERKQQAAATAARTPAPVPLPANQAAPEIVSVLSAERPKAQRFYAVACGRSVGIFSSWAVTERSVKGYSGAKHKRFRTLARAKAWLRDNGPPLALDETSDLSTDEDGDRTVYGPTITRN
jgi:hypothetical protein